MQQRLARLQQNRQQYSASALACADQDYGTDGYLGANDRELAIDSAFDEINGVNQQNEEFVKNLGLTIAQDTN